MIELFFPLFTGHLIADFWLQPGSWVNDKKENGWRSKKLFIHSLLAAILPVLFTFKLSLWWFIPIIFASHYLIDLLKTYAKANILFFLIDQILHIGILWILATFFTANNIHENWFKFWFYACGIIAVTNPLGILIGMFLKSVTKTKSNPGKIDASGWIGIFERILIVIFVVTGQLQAIGFLVAAKSVFRFSETQKDGNKKAEYFLLGTLVSFTLAIVVGLGIKYLGTI